MSSSLAFPARGWEDATNADAVWAFNRYEEVRARLPSATFPDRSTKAADLLALADNFDVFILDAFGVLNVGERPVASAQAAVAKLAQAGKTLIVLSNGATRDDDAALAKYRSLGFDFEPWQVCSSRNVLVTALSAFPSHMCWGVAAPAYSNIESLGVRCCPLGDDAAVYEQVDGFVYLSRRGWTPNRQALLHATLEGRQRPVLCGNPDLVAPLDDGFSIEPGAFAHALADACLIEVAFLGKPFGDAFEAALARAAAHREAAMDKARVAMVGDTLHTDILGGAAAGLRTVLVTDQGFFRGLDVDRYVALSGIVPDFAIPTT